MRNIGIKSYSQNLVRELPVGNAYVNLCPQEANVIFLIPLIEEMGIYYVYNYLARETNGTIGKGGHINIFKSINTATNTITNADFSSDVYELGEMNKLTGLILTKESDDHYGLSNRYILKDGDKNTFVYNEPVHDYPSEIVSNNGVRTIVIQEAGKIKVKNGNYSTEIAISGDGTVEQLLYKHNEAILKQVDITNFEDMMISIEYLLPRGGRDYIEFTFDEGHSIELLSSFNNGGEKYIFENSKLKEIYVVEQNKAIKEMELSFDDTNNVTTIINSFGEKEYCFFEKRTVGNETIYLNSLSINEKGDVATVHLNDELKPAYSFGYNRAMLNDAVLQEQCIDISGNPYNAYSSATTVENELLGSIKVCNPLHMNRSYGVSGLGGDSFTLSCFVKATNNQCEITVHLNEKNEKIKVFNNWKLLCVRLDAVESFDSINIRMDSDGEVLVTPIKVFKNQFANVYKYNENGNTIENGDSVINYDDNLVTSLSSNSGVLYNFTYNDNNELTGFKGPHGITVRQDYTDHKVTRQFIKGEYWEIDSTTLYRNDLISAEYDSLEYANYEYDNFDAIKKITYPINCMDVASRDAYGKITKLLLKENNSEDDKHISAEYEYDSLQRISKITAKNGSEYCFTYDDDSRLETVKLNRLCVFKYTYYENGLIKRQYFGSSSDYYEFEYNDKQLPTKMSYSNGQLSYIFLYDEYERLNEIKENRNGVTKTYESYVHDVNGNTVKISNSAKELTRLSNCNDHKIRATSKFNDKNIIQEHNRISRSTITHPESILCELSEEKDYSIAPFVDSFLCYGPHKTYGCGSWGATHPTKPSKVSSIYAMTSENRMVYDLERQPENGCLNETIAFWYKPHRLHDKGCIFKLDGANSNAGIAIYDIGKNHLEVVQIDNNGGEHKLITVGSEYYHKRSEWNFISLNVFFDGNRNNSKCTLTINTKIFKDNGGWAAQSNLVSGNIQIRFGYEFRKNDNQPELYNKVDGCYYTLLAIWDVGAWNINSIFSFYKKTKDYLMDNTIREFSDVDFSTTSLVKDTKTNFGSFKVFPLDNNALSLDYNQFNESDFDKPYQFDAREGFGIDTDRAFNFNDKLKKYAFVADGNRLSYKVNMTNSGTFAALFYLDNLNDKQFLFDSKSNSTRLSLFRNQNKRLVMMFNNTPKTNENAILEDGWHSVALSFDTTITSDSDASGGEHRFTVFIDGKPYEYVFYNISPIAIREIMLGRCFDSETEYDYITYRPLYGQIANFAYSNSYSSKETVEKLFNDLTSLIKMQIYDEIGASRGEEIRKGNLLILGKSVGYSNSSPRVESEHYDSTNEGSFLSRVYSYDYYGNLDGITTEAGSERYESWYTHDYRGYLIEESSTSPDWTIKYTYDDNGNIKTRTYGPRYEVCGFGYPQPTRPTSDRPVITDTFVYDRLVPDRLVRFNNTIIKYESETPGNITSYGDWNFEYEGRRLVRATKIKRSIDPFVGTQIQKTMLEFEYNYCGLRTSKKYTFSVGKSENDLTIREQKVINYEYDNGELIYEKSNDNEIIYLYDENNILYGYILNGEKYFYIKDFLCNILGIVDYNGRIVAKYNHDAFGNLLASEGDIYNPIRYKGYYYDSELEMYYCKSRFYVPKLCRWLNMDNPDFLDFNSLTSMNLFAYCDNSPVICVDPSGHFCVWAVILIATLIGAAVGFGTATAVDYANDGKVFNGDMPWYGYVLFTGIGAAAGALVGCAVVGGGASLTIPIIKFAGEGMLSLGSVLVTVSAAEIATAVAAVGVGTLAGLGVMAYKRIGKSNGYEIGHNYPDDHHNPTHVHIYGDGIRDKVHGIRVDLNGNVIETTDKLPFGARKAFRRLIKEIMKALAQWM